MTTTSSPGPRRTPVKPPKWGYFPRVPKTSVIEVGPRRPISRDSGPLKPGEDGARDVYLDGVKIGHVEQYTHESSVSTMGRLTRVIGHPTTWVIDGRDHWWGYPQMNEAVYHLVDAHLDKGRSR